jgi:hypothetical protein
VLPPSILFTVDSFPFSGADIFFLAPFKSHSCLVSLPELNDSKRSLTSLSCWSIIEAKKISLKHNLTPKNSLKHCLMPKISLKHHLTPKNIKVSFTSEKYIKCHEFLRVMS